eukprot:6184176-Pleurochrysis_carterae.AAC.2
MYHDMRRRRCTGLGNHFRRQAFFVRDYRSRTERGNVRMGFLCPDLARHPARNGPACVYLVQQHQQFS